MDSIIIHVELLVNSKQSNFDRYRICVYEYQFNFGRHDQAVLSSNVQPEDAIFAMNKEIQFWIEELLEWIWTQY